MRQEILQVDEEAFNFLDEEPETPRNVRPYVKESSFASVATAQPKVATGVKKILRQQVIDRFCVLRTRVTLTPTMCTVPHCSYDAASKWGGWENAPESERPILLDVLKKHSEFHSINEELVVDEGLLDNQWLQSAKGI